MRIPGLLLVLSAVLLVLMGIVPWFGADEAGPEPHPRFESMQRGGDPGPSWLGWAAGLVMTAFFGAAMALGFPGHRQARTWIWVATGAYGLVYAGLMVTFAHSAASALPVLVAGFPVPTALLVYGIYLFPVCMLLIPVLRFREWFFRLEDEARFHRLLESRSQEEP